MKNYQKFLEELEITGHPGIPGEGEKREGEGDYLKDVEARAKARLGIAGTREGGREVGQVVNTLMSSLHELQGLCRGKEKELEKLVTDVITKMYKPIIDQYEITLDIKFATPQQIGVEQRAGGFWDPKLRKEYTEEEKKGKKPVIKARGLDISLLFHEAVKGIWLVLASNATPKDKAIRDEIKRLVTFKDEPEDWRYGPEIAADLRDFINSNPKIDKYPNIREDVWKMMCDEKNMSSTDFIELVRGMLAKTDAAKNKVDKLIDKVIINREKFNKEMAEYERQLAEYEEWERSQKLASKPSVRPEAQAQRTKPVNPYQTMSERELTAAIYRAMDAGDWDLVDELSAIKEKRFGK